MTVSLPIEPCEKCKALMHAEGVKVILWPGGVVAWP